MTFFHIVFPHNMTETIFSDVFAAVIKFLLHVTCFPDKMVVQINRFAGG